MICVSTVTQIGRGIVLAGALAALTLTTAPTPAHAGGSGVGAAIGLGILGGVIAGAQSPRSSRTMPRRGMVIRPSTTTSRRPFITARLNPITDHTRTAITRNNREQRGPAEVGVCRH